MRAGVPVLKRRSRIPAASSDADKLTAARWPFGPPAKAASPIITRPRRYVPVASTNARQPIRSPVSVTIPVTALPSKTNCSTSSCRTTRRGSSASASRIAF